MCIRDRIFAAALKLEGAEERLRKARDGVDSFAKAHPLKSLSFTRDSLTGHPESQAVPMVDGLGGVVAGVEQDLVTLQRILSAYLEYLPSISRWEAELM